MVIVKKSEKLNNDKVTVNLSFLPWLCLFLFLITQFALGGHTIYSHLSYVAFCGLTFVMILYNKNLKLYYSHYFTTFVLFMIYNFTLAGLGRAVYPDVVWSKLMYMLINLIIYIALYNFIIESNNRELLFKLTIFAAVVSLGFIMLNVEDIWTGRLGHTMTAEEPSFFVNGIPIYLSGNGISTFTGIGALFSLYFVGVNKKRLYIIPYLFLGFGTLLSGSRKGLLLLGLFTIYAIFMYFEGANISKLVKIVIALAILYVLIMRVPVFYSLIGKRTEALISTLMGMESEESSMDNRLYLASLAKNYISERPFFGWGLGNFSRMANSKYSVDNNYLDIVVSCGFGGLLIYYSYILVAIKSYFKVSSEKRALSTNTMLFALFCFLILDTGSVMYSTRTQLIWVVVFFAFVAVDLKNSVCTKDLKG